MALLAVKSPKRLVICTADRSGVRTAEESAAGFGSSMRSSCRGDAPGHCCDGGARRLAPDQELGGDRGCDRRGRLVVDFGEADRAYQPVDVLAAEPDLAQRAHEAGPLGAAADQADIRKAPRL